MDKSLGWYSGYVLALANMEGKSLSDADREVLDHLSKRLHQLHADEVAEKV